MMIFQFIGIQIFSFMYLLLILIVFSLKKKYISVENDIFKILLLFTLFLLISDIGLNYSIKYSNFVPLLNKILCYISLIGYQIWMALLMLYVLILGNNGKYNDIKDLYRKNKYIKLGTFIVIMLACIVLFLPFNYLYDVKYRISYITGVATIYNYIVIIIYFLTLLITLFLNKNKVSLLQRIPLFAFIIVAGIFLPLQKFNSDVPVIVMPLMTLAIVIMYSTLENPDLKLIDELNKAKKETEESSKIKTKFLNNISDNIKNPINNIISYSDLLQNEEVNNNVKEEILKINYECSNLIHMINNTIDMSNLEFDDYVVEYNVYDLNELINDLQSLVKNTLINDKVKFIVDIDENVPTFFNGDRNKIFKILSNLLLNAIKYTKIGKITLSLKYNKVDENNVKLIFKISDTGIGIRKEDFDKIFDKFGEGELSENRGSGLGLAVAKRFSVLLNASLTFDSVFGAGSNFYFVINQEVSKESKSEESNNNINIDKFSNKNILLIDQNEDDIFIIKRILDNNNLHMDIQELNNYIESYNLDSSKYDLILVKKEKDNEADIVNGLKKITPNAKIITIFSNEKYKLTFKDEGFDDYLLIPLKSSKVKKIINKYLK